MDRWLIAFLLTLAVELPIVLVVLRRETSPGRILAAGLAANLMTHPVVWFLLPRLFSSYLVYLLVAELGAFLAEALVYRAALRPLSRRMAVSASALANAASLGLGLLLYRLGWL